MQPHSQVAGAEVKDFAELLHGDLIELAEHKRLGQRSGQVAEAAVEHAPELFGQQSLLGGLPARGVLSPEAVLGEE